MFSFGLIDLDSLTLARLIAHRAARLASRLATRLTLSATRTATSVERGFHYRLDMFHFS